MSQQPKTNPERMEKIVSLCKRRGFVFQSSEIYGGLNGCWDYGPLGVELKRNLKDYWWRVMVRERDDIVGMDGSILMNRNVWKASGHEETFTDPMVDCRVCKARLRADQLPEKDGVPYCSNCGSRDLTEARAFNLMFLTYVGATQDESSKTYLRPETAQAIFVQFKNVLATSRKKLPFGIAQIGKAFRNEITPGNFTFRTREFEQMEIEYFCRPEDAPRYHQEWIQARYQWYLDLGIRPENLTLRPHEKDELAHYAQSEASTGTTDIEYKFPFMDKPAELEGIANRADFDLSQHAKFSGQRLSYFDQTTNEHIVPYVIEPSAGADRATLAFLVDAYHEEEIKPGDTRNVLRFHPKLAPVKVAVLPLLKKREDIVAIAQKLKGGFAKKVSAVYDDTAGIGKLYRRQDEIGTPFCITVDVETVEKDQAVTVRDRDTMEQVRVSIDQVERFVLDKLGV